ncbi:hypothetical protein CGZ97_18585 [Enemella evansiae]|nr:hypothetical protein CGZ97_18585 [Enemella evansiae]
MGVVLGRRRTRMEGLTGPRLVRLPGRRVLGVGLLWRHRGLRESLLLREFRLRAPWLGLLPRRPDGRLLGRALCGLRTGRPHQVLGTMRAIPVLTPVPRPAPGLILGAGHRDVRSITQSPPVWRWRPQRVRRETARVRRGEVTASGRCWETAAEPPSPVSLLEVSAVGVVAGFGAAVEVALVVGVAFGVADLLAVADAVGFTVARVTFLVGVAVALGFAVVALLGVADFDALGVAVASLRAFGAGGVADSVGVTVAVGLPVGVAVGSVGGTWVGSFVGIGSFVGVGDGLGVGVCDGAGSKPSFGSMPSGASAVSVPSLGKVSASW